MHEDLLRSLVFPLGSLLMILGLSYPLWRLTSWLELRRLEKLTRRLQELRADPPPADHRPPPPPGPPPPRVFLHPTQEDAERFTRRAVDPRFDAVDLLQENPGSWPVAGSRLTRLDQWAISAMIDRAVAELGRSIPVTREEVERQDAQATEEAPRQWTAGPYADPVADLDQLEKDGRRAIEEERQKLQERQGKPGPVITLEPVQDPPGPQFSPEGAQFAPPVALFNFLEGKYPPVPYLGNDTGPHLGNMAYFLLSCPFCLAPFEEVELTEDPDGNPIHRCGRCGCLGPVSGNDQAVSWENRKPLSQ